MIEEKTLKEILTLKVDMSTMFKGTKEINKYIKIVLRRNQELFKLLDWYLAQNIHYRKQISRAGIRAKLYRNRILELNKLLQPRELTSEDKKRILKDFFEE